MKILVTQHVDDKGKAFTEEKQEELKRRCATWLCRNGWPSLLEEYGIMNQMPSGGQGWSPVKHWKKKNGTAFREIMEAFSFQVMSGDTDKITVEQTESLENGAVVCRPGGKFASYMEVVLKEATNVSQVDFIVPAKERKKRRDRDDRAPYRPTHHQRAYGSVSQYSF